MEPSSSDRPKLQKTGSNSSSFRVRRPSRTTSKYGSIVEERNFPNENDDTSDQDDVDADDGSDPLDLHGNQTHQGSNYHLSDRMSATSLDHEITLKDKQDAMNTQHPFGLPLWKPALYKKSRSVVRKANKALHSSPASSSDYTPFLNPGNLLWAAIFGWWLALVVCIVSLVLSLCGGRAYGIMLRELSLYLLWPFGRYVERLVEITPSVMNDLARERSGQSSVVIDDDDQVEVDDEEGHHHHKHKRYNWFHAVFETVKLGPVACLYYVLFFCIIAPLLLLVSSICWMCVVTVPMAKLNYILVRHLRRHPLSLRFHSKPSILTGVHQQPTIILLCTYQAFGWQYYKYTYNGINIMFINLIPLVFFVIFDDYVLKTHFPDAFITSPRVIFGLSLASVIPLSYFIGMGVSSVSAQSSMGLGAVINATFGSIIEIILYAAALMAGKSSLVEGSLIGSILAGVLLMPGFSMVSGAVKRKEQRFNAKSAGVTSTMLIMAIIGALSPTLFYQFFGSFELRCTGCPEVADPNGTIACSHCYYDQMNPAEDPVYQNSVKPFMLICAAILPSAYVIGLLFSLHTHADMVWKNPTSTSTKHPVVEAHPATVVHPQRLYPVHIIPQEQGHPNEQTPINAYGIQAVDHPSLINANLSTTTAATISQPLAFVHAKEPEEEEEEEAAAGHDSPNWGKSMSYSVLFGCTLLYSIIAEILVQTVDLVMENVAIDEKFLGLTLFALVPNITEFMNAISFALYGNIVLSMEIGSAYALQVCLLQIPAMVAFSLWYNWGKEEVKKFTFNLMFPRWDVISVIFSVFLLTYTYQEGKSNYFKGSILCLSYVVLVAGFYYIPSFSNASNLYVGIEPRI
ncbi:Sodium/calcium exchanger protein-domain-containing protein [Parasitella parasitica]|nr:Sodium/calcium exchanger protein-domain-containing protein [Parasitella parasitica]